MFKRLTGLFAAIAMCGSLFAQGNVVVLTQQEIAGLLASACGPQAAPQGKALVHRNAAGNMLYIVSPGQFEALVYAQQQTCNPLQPESLNLWRNAADGAVTAQLVKRYEGERLLVQGSVDGIRGQHFDISPEGLYMVVSHGDVSSVSPVARPYVRTIELNMDARRIFPRQNGFLVVGANKATDRVEAVPVVLQEGNAIAGAPIVVPGVPAGVQILDYNAQTDELLMGGLNATGVTSFAIANLSTGQASLVENTKPGAVTALFIADPALRARLSGQPIPASASGQQGQGQSDGGSRFNPFGWFGRN